MTADTTERIRGHKEEEREEREEREKGIHTAGKHGEQLKSLYARQLFLRHGPRRSVISTAVLSIHLGRRPAGSESLDDGLQHAQLDPSFLLLHMADRLVIQRAQGGSLVGVASRVPNLREECLRARQEDRKQRTKTNKQQGFRGR